MISSMQAREQLKVYTDELAERGSGSGATIPCDFSFLNEIAGVIDQLETDRAELRETADELLEMLTFAEKAKRPDWNGEASPESLIGRARIVIRRCAPPVDDE